jgi:hypothetical protein
MLAQVPIVESLKIHLMEVSTFQEVLCDVSDISKREYVFDTIIFSLTYQIHSLELLVMCSLPPDILRSVLREVLGQASRRGQAVQPRLHVQRHQINLMIINARHFVKLTLGLLSWVASCRQAPQ